MDSFYLTVLSIALVFLILILTFIGILMTRKNTIAFPPVANTCPDGWKLSKTDPSSCVIPMEPSGVNIGNDTIYINKTSNAFQPTFQLSKVTPGLKQGLNGAPSSINFADQGWSGGNYTGLNLVCAQKKWASQFGVNWDGVSNYNSC
jgi:hypothetical protein